MGEDKRTTLELIRTGEVDTLALFNKWKADPNLTNVSMKKWEKKVESAVSGHRVDDNDWWVEAEIIDHLALLHKKYTIKPVDMRKTPGWGWGSYQMEIWMNDFLHTDDGQFCITGSKKIGEYHRNYDPLNTFYPFLHHGREYALYSKDYTATRIMTLPDCKDLCGEEPASNGFCPVEYLVPYDPFNKCHGDFGFVHGCVWAGPYWVIMIDLSRIDEGILSVDDKFEEIVIPDEMTLAQCIKWRNPYLDIISEQSYHLEKGKYV